jgi:hypothetical protein
MTPSDLDRIEEVLGITLPEAYRATMGIYPFDSDSTASDCMLPNDAEWVINANRGLDRHFLLHHGKGRWVPTKNHLLIGTDGGEEYYYLDLRRNPVRCLASTWRPGIRPSSVTTLNDLSVGAARLTTRSSRMSERPLSVPRDENGGSYGADETPAFVKSQL